MTCKYSEYCILFKMSKIVENYCLMHNVVRKVNCAHTICLLVHKYVMNMKLTLSYEDLGVTYDMMNMSLSDILFYEFI